MKVLWTPEARQDRLDIWEFLEAENPRAAARIDQVLSDAAAALSQFPMRGRKGQIAGTRELIPHESYRLVYEVDNDTVWVLAVVHTAREWPPARG